MMKPEKAIGGSIVVLLGIVLLLYNLGMIPTDIWKYWPLILVFLGIAIIFSQQLHLAEKKGKK